MSERVWAMYVNESNEPEGYINLRMVGMVNVHKDYFRKNMGKYCVYAWIGELRYALHAGTEEECWRWIREFCEGVLS